MPLHRLSAHNGQRLLARDRIAGDGIPSHRGRAEGASAHARQWTANTRFVCPECACWVYSLPRGGVIRVRAGTLDDTTWLRPTRHIWTRSKQPWVTFGDGDETFEEQPPE
jgi:hypothetical protein